MIRPVALTALLLAASTAACLDDSITGTRPLTFTLEASPSTAIVGDSLDFTYQATGTSIGGVILDYGDGVADTVLAETFNEVERAGTLRYAYTVAGTFEVVGRVVTSIGTRADTVQVEITDGSE
jgi:hypothetical protein